MTYQPEGGGDQVPEHQGQKYLDMLGLSDLGDSPLIGKDGVALTHSDGTQVLGRDFLEIGRCREMALPALVGYESLQENDPMRVRFGEILREQVTQYVLGMPEEH